MGKGKPEDEGQAETEAPPETGADVLTEDDDAPEAGEESGGEGGEHQGAQEGGLPPEAGGGDRPDEGEGEPEPQAG